MQVANFSVWIQEKIFEPDALTALLSTSLSTGGRRGTTSFTLPDLLSAAIRSNENGTAMGRAATFVDVECILPRERKSRWDVRLTDAWVDKMRSVNVAFAKACALTERLRRSDVRCGHAKVDWHAQVVFPGSPDQVVHTDDRTDRRGRRCYYTLIVPLVDNPRAGGTYFPALGGSGGTVFASYGGALCFDGTVEHAGLGNRSRQNRYFLYAVVYSGRDGNCD